MNVGSLIGRRVGGRHALSRATAAVIAMMVLQLFVAIRFFTTPDAMTDRTLGWNILLLNRQTLFGSVLLGGLMALVLARPRLAMHGQTLMRARAAPRGHLPLIVQVGSCIACYACVWPLYFRTAEVGVWGWPLLIAWCASVIACTAASLWLLAPVHYWRQLLIAERRTFLVAGLGMVGSGVLIAALYRAWTAVPLLASLTLNGSAWLLRARYPQMTVDPGTAIIAIDDFSVQITDACSGYFGVSLTLGFLACYGHVFRAEIPPWLRLALFPIGVALSLTLNAVRIAVLVVLGVEVSPEVASQGFHTHAGSIAMVLGCAIIIALMHRLVVARAIAADGDTARLGWRLDFEAALLIPLMTLLAVTLLTGAASGDFVWLYPLRVIAVALALRLCWRHLRHLGPLFDGPWWWPLAVGSGVFVLWIALIDADADANARFGEALRGATPLAASGWLLMRTLGAVVTVPLAEELAFRGYLMAVLSRQPVLPGVRLRFDGLGYLGSSLLFGALHGQWLAGTVAGLAYGALRYRRDRIWDAALAHMTTNLLLALYVLATGNGSYW